MKFIKEIELKNFQSHANSILKLDPYLNVIVGPSDSGKSSIIRAIKWVLFNEPSGDFFIREGESEASVSLSFSDGSKLTRFRSRSKNTYIINYSNGEELILSGFGLKVPEEVIELTGISKVPFDQDSSQIINIADQLEGPFLLSEKNSTKAFVIGGLAGVDIVDDSIGELLKELRNLNIEDKRLESNISDIDEDLKNFDRLNSIKKIHGELREIYDLVLKKEEYLKKLKILSKNYRALNEEKEKVETILIGLKNLDQIRDVFIDLNTSTGLYTKYRSLERKKKDLSDAIDKTKGLQSKFKGLDELRLLEKDIGQFMEDYNQLYSRSIKYRAIEKEKGSIDKFLENFKELDKIEAISRSISDKNLEYSKYIAYNKSYKNIRNRIVKGSEYIENFNNIDETIKTYREIDRKTSLYDKLLKVSFKYSKIYKEKGLVEGELNKLDRTIDIRIDEYRAILEEAEVCPTCFSRIDEEVIANIIKELNGDRV